MQMPAIGMLAAVDLQSSSVTSIRSMNQELFDYLTGKFSEYEQTRQRVLTNRKLRSRVRKGVPDARAQLLGRLDREGHHQHTVWRHAQPHQPHGALDHRVRLARARARADR